MLKQFTKDLGIDMLDWQKEFIKTFEGVKPGEMMIMMAGRRVGKSQLVANWGQLFKDVFAERPVTDLILSTGTIMNAPYYTVEPEGGVWADMEAWARQTYGEPSEIWNIGKSDEFAWPDMGRWYMNNRKFWFRDEKDRTMFILKWR